ncbi:hypothetical protein PUN71_000945 [Arthrobacter sp. NQ7]|uniref:Uncharacterized protein n=1 Tax=Pseudarthrobacter phenanthrenivorans TaxID=361575 RepID=A0A0B4DQU8_PSEPS|nr:MULTISPECIES: hypothetical protein [Micrococcaceae]KIC66740.1 hypothetical protein RM50_10025 [Pseudarthrobacter phenanthrenivorans]MDJ0455766.1 hypothetical protein [Arthrobacter sp. NQ7]
MLEIAGLPAHILLIHGVVVLGPLAGVAAVAFALIRRSRRFLAWPLGVLALLLVPLSVLTAEAGEQLEKATGRSQLIEEHGHQGSFLRYVTVLFLVAVAVQIAAAFPSLLTRRPAFRGLRGLLESRWLVPATSVVGVLAGIFLVYQTIVTGHSGAVSVWAGR